jgi:uncharacterized protein YbaP (TraB family)
VRSAALLLSLWLLVPSARAAEGRHCLWELHGEHNTVYLLGSIHVLRSTDYPLAAPLLAAYSRSRALVMEIDLDELDAGRLGADMLASATLGRDASLRSVMGESAYAHAAADAKRLHVDLSTYERFAPWFVAEAVSELQLSQLGFDPQAGVESYFLARARADHKPVSGLETVADQLGVLAGMPMDLQTEYLLSSLTDAQALPAQLDAMVAAWKRGDGSWFAAEIMHEFGSEPRLYESLLAARNRRWTPKLEALLHENEDYLVIVGTAHLVGPGSVIELLGRDGIPAIQR